jgi:hypothetical protein
MGETAQILVGLGALGGMALMLVVVLRIVAALTRNTMLAVRAAAERAGMRLVEGSWQAQAGSLRGNAMFGGWPVSFVINTGKGGGSKLYLALPRMLCFSPTLAPGPPGMGGLLYAEVRGGLALARGWAEPPEAQRLLTPELVRRLESHPNWKSSRVTLTANLVEYSGGGTLDDAAELREVLEVMVLVAERGLAC